MVTEDRQSMQLQVEKLQADMERNEKFVSKAWEAVRAAEEQRHSEGAAPTRSAVLKSQNDSETYTSATESIESMSVDHQNDGEESSEGRSSVAAARSALEQLAGSRACCRSDTEGRCRASWLWNRR